MYQGDKSMIIIFENPINKEEIGNIFLQNYHQSLTAISTEA